MKPSRRRLVRSVYARITSRLLRHRILLNVLNCAAYDQRIRLLAASIIRTELEARSVVDRLIEYIYVALRLPQRGRVTIGPGQIAVSILLHTQVGCSCYGRTGMPFWPVHYCRSQHQAAAILAHVNSLRSKLSGDRAIANAYVKGHLAGDLHVATVYSEVVERLVPRFAVLHASLQKQSSVALHQSRAPR